jgi:HSP20 family protein
MAEKELQLKEKQELQTGAENTRELPIFVPAVDIFESGDVLTLVADMPGTAPDGVTIDLNDDLLTIRGAVKGEDGNGGELLREYAVGDYYRQFTLSDAIDRAKIEATMKDGVLKVVLPKSEAVKPRRVAVKVS